MQKHILLIEDDEVIHNSLKKFLVQEGYQVSSAYDGEEALALFAENDIQLILLDLIIPKLSGEMVLRQIRKESKVPVIVISALNDEQTQQLAYMQEIDDYVSKPFSLKILLYKIAAVLRRTYSSQEECFVWKDVVLYAGNYKVDYKGKEVNLTAKEFEILEILMRNIGRIYTREQLLNLLWDYDFDGYSRTIDVHVKNIRKKICSEIITTVTKIGYKVEE
ncbi:MAG: response regulator transcription factor [Clostridioides sp.]|nr:response regulator transcription factor [Clostridioides sp.]